MVLKKPMVYSFAQATTAEAKRRTASSARSAAIASAESAGLEAHGLNPRAVAVMREAGVDIPGRTSDVIDPKLPERADYIITLCGSFSTKGNKERVSRFAGCRRVAFFIFQGIKIMKIVSCNVIIVGLTKAKSGSGGSACRTKEYNLSKNAISGRKCAHRSWTTR